MYFRCTTCLAATWIGSGKPPTASDSVTCHECDRSFLAAPVPELGSTESSHYRHTSSFASSEQLDMATAYSFLLGLISREELTAVEDFEVEEPALDLEELLLLDGLEMETPPENIKTGVVMENTQPTFDPGFQKAVARGRLTVEEAMRRGDRTTYATTLSNRYRLSMELALAVADNRITLFQARKRQEAKPVPVASAAARPTGGALTRLAVVSLVALAVLGLTWAFSRNEPPARSRTTSTQATRSSSNTGSTATPSTVHSDTTATSYSSTEILTDDSGRTTKVVGLDPRTVLLAYCGTDPATATCDPLEIMDSVPPAREVRLGTFRDPDSPETVHAITIQRDRFSRRWVAGNGNQPIPVADPQAVPDDAERIAEERR